MMRLGAIFSTLALLMVIPIAASADTVRDHRGEKPRENVGTTKKPGSSKDASTTDHRSTPNRAFFDWEIGRGLNPSSYNLYLEPGWNPHPDRTFLNRGLNLYNRSNGKALVKQQRRIITDAVPGSDLVGLDDAGVNLGWISRKEARASKRRQPFTFHRHSGYDGKPKNRPIEYEEEIAIHVGDPRRTPETSGFLKYTKRSRGINLAIVPTYESYEWKIFGGPAGTPIRHQGRDGRSMAVGLYNTKKEDFLVHCKRKNGVNLRWAKDCKSAGGNVTDNRK